ncbi:hypothetical protein [Campylobacter porcelli]|uniref:hypothetical protein n=1 Tax=Campylobacter porcelli TaxID=1660073 RepID=UPI000A33A0B1|nr:hypothetical protein [Campylobacter sp. P0124]
MNKYLLLKNQFNKNIFVINNYMVVLYYFLLRSGAKLHFATKKKGGGEPFTETSAKAVAFAGFGNP